MSNLKPKELRKIIKEIGTRDMAWLLESLVVGRKEEGEKLTSKLLDSLLWLAPVAANWEELTADQLDVNLQCVIYRLHGQKIPVVLGSQALTIAHARSQRGMAVHLEAKAKAWCDPTQFVLHKRAGEKWRMYATYRSGLGTGYKLIGDMEDVHAASYKKLGVDVVKFDPAGG